MLLELIGGGVVVLVCVGCVSFFYFKVSENNCIRWMFGLPSRKDQTFEQMFVGAMMNQAVANMTSDKSSGRSSGSNKTLEESGPNIKVITRDELQKMLATGQVPKDGKNLIVLYATFWQNFL